MNTERYDIEEPPIPPTPHNSEAPDSISTNRGKEISEQIRDNWAYNIKISRLKQKEHSKSYKLAKFLYFLQITIGVILGALTAIEGTETFSERALIAFGAGNMINSGLIPVFKFKERSDKHWLNVTGFKGLKYAFRNCKTVDEYNELKKRFEDLAKDEEPIMSFCRKDMEAATNGKREIRFSMEPQLQEELYELNKGLKLPKELINYHGSR